MTETATTTRPLKVFIIAGEASGDKLGAAAMAGLKSLREVEFRGVGGQAMGEEGLSSQFDMSELSLMGLLEVLPKYFHLKKRIREVAEAILEWQPDVVLTIDSPDFCLRVADIVKERSDLRICHYVAPTVWAWRPERAAKMASKVDQVLALFPFEPPYFEKEGLRCDFVGHPVVTDAIATNDEIDAFKSQHNIGASPLVLVLPGSRKGEIGRLASPFGAALAHVQKDHPEARFVLPMAQNVEALVREECATWDVDPILIAPSDKISKRAAFKAADVALAASGTVSLELAANETPMVIAYRMQWLTQKIIERKLLIDTVTLVNLVSESRVVPEFLADECRPEIIGPALSAALSDARAQKGDQADALSLTMERLGKGEKAPGLRAAEAILAAL